MESRKVGHGDHITLQKKRASRGGNGDSTNSEKANLTSLEWFDYERESLFSTQSTGPQLNLDEE